MTLGVRAENLPPGVRAENRSAQSHGKVRDADVVLN